MPARALGLRPALRAGFRKPSGEEAAVSVLGVAGYGDSGCRRGADGRRTDLGGSDRHHQTTHMSAPRQDEVPRSAAAGRRLR